MKETKGYDIVVLRNTQGYRDAWAMLLKLMCTLGDTDNFRIAMLSDSVAMKAYGSQVKEEGYGLTFDVVYKSSDDEHYLLGFNYGR